MKVIDCFTFYNEIQLLTYRLAILDNTVDYFIIVEATHTYAGYEKELYFEKNKELFSKYLHKIIHVIVDDFKYTQPTINFCNGQQWENERYQRRSIINGIKKLNLLNEDIIVISDLDEIPDPIVLDKIKNASIHITANTLTQDFYYYNLNSKVRDKWIGTRLLTYEKFNELNMDCAVIRNQMFPTILNAGWHLSFFGDSTCIQNKMTNYSHQEFYGEFYRSIENIEYRLKNSIDPYGRNHSILDKIMISDNEYLPPMYTKYLHGLFKYKIAKHITFFYTPARHGTFVYLNRIIDEVNSYGHNTDLFIHTNTSIDILQFLNKNTTGIISQVTHDLTNINPWYLPRKCRDLLKSQKNNYDIFIQSEDDVLIKKQSIDYWLNYKDKVMKYNYNLGFFITEVSDTNVEFCVNVGSPKDGSQDGHLTKIITLDGVEYVLNDKNTHHCSWIYDKREFNRFVNSIYYDPNNIRGYGVCESVAIGLHGIETDWYKGTLIPIVKDTILESGSKLYHMPNKYWNLPTSTWDLISFPDIVRR